MAVQVGPRIDECRAWAGIAPGLGKGPDNRVLVHGQPTVEKPWITWRRNRPSAIFGDMGKHADPSTPRLGTVQRFLDDHPDLFGITDPRVVGTLGTVSENTDPDGTVGSLSDGELFAEKFPDVALKAVLLLDDEASVVDLRNAMRAASALSSAVAPHSPEIVAAIEDAFARHGVDSTLESFCADSANEDFCH